MFINAYYKLIINYHRYRNTSLKLKIAYYKKGCVMAQKTRQKEANENLVSPISAQRNRHSNRLMERKIPINR